MIDRELGLCPINPPISTQPLTMLHTLPLLCDWSVYVCCDCEECDYGWWYTLVSGVRWWWWWWWGGELSDHPEGAVQKDMLTYREKNMLYLYAFVFHNTLPCSAATFYVNLQQNAVESLIKSVFIYFLSQYDSDGCSWCQIYSIIMHIFDLLQFL